ncbi:GGDEF domain-containing protein [Fibrobacterota bacterium]
MEQISCRDDAADLKEELEKVKSQFNIFYTLTKTMRTTLRLDETAYIILTGLTARQGLGFNRAFLFLADNEVRVLNGFMGIGPVDGGDAQQIWNLIESQHMDLYMLIYNYRSIKDGIVQPRLMEITRSLKVPLKEEPGLACDVFRTAQSMLVSERLIQEKYANDRIIATLQLKDFAVSALRSFKGPTGMIVVDNIVTGKKITEEDLRIFSMFADQAALAIENCREYEKTLVQSQTDSLTALWNHGYFQWRLEEELASCSSNKVPLSLFLADLDYFKNFNDAFGHQQGDAALKLIAEALKACSRNTDIACRYGGEEFALIMPRLQMEEAFSTAENFRAAVERISIAGASFSVSVGLSCFPKDAANKQALIHAADLALYRAKKDGRNRVAFV